MDYNDMSEKEQLAAVQQDGYAIRYIRNPSERVQLAAVQQDGYAIQFIRNPSERVQIAAVQQNGYVIKHIENPSERVQIAAVQKHGRSIGHIENPSERVQLAAVQQDGYAIQFIRNPSERVQLAAVQQNGRAIGFIDNPSERVIRASRGEPVETDRHEYDSMPTFEESFDRVIDRIINEAMGDSNEVPEQEGDEDSRYVKFEVTYRSSNSISLIFQKEDFDPLIHLWAPSGSISSEAELSIFENEIEKLSLMPKDKMLDVPLKSLENKTIRQAASELASQHIKNELGKTPESMNMTVYKIETYYNRLK